MNLIKHLSVSISVGTTTLTLLLSLCAASGIFIINKISSESTVAETFQSRKWIKFTSLHSFPQFMCISSVILIVTLDLLHKITAIMCTVKLYPWIWEKSKLLFSPGKLQTILWQNWPLAMQEIKRLVLCFSDSQTFAIFIKHYDLHAYPWLKLGN